MPFTPFHLGPALLIGVLLFYWVDLPTLLVATVIVDVRAGFVLYGPLSGPVHGVLTTFVGGTAVALVVWGVAASLPERVQRLGSPFRLANTARYGPMLAGAILGVFLHVVLDATLYTDVRPFWPLEWNPFLLDLTTGPSLVYGGCVVVGLLGLGLFVVRWRERALPATG